MHTFQAVMSGGAESVDGVLRTRMFGASDTQVAGHTGSCGCSQSTVITELP